MRIVNYGAWMDDKGNLQEVWIDGVRVDPKTLLPIKEEPPTPEPVNPALAQPDEERDG